ncbi:MAG: hypothetical protein QXV75_08075 [Candidatus Bathyarchaeia archaeon]
MVFYVNVGVSDKVLIRYRVKDWSTDQPVSGATVTLYADGTLVGTKTTDENGETDWFSVKVNSWLTGKITKSGYADYDITGPYITPEFDNQTFTVFMSPSNLYSTVTFVTKNLQGQPIKDAEIFVNGKSIGKTDENGQLVKQLNYGAYKVIAKHSLYGEKEVNITVAMPAMTVEIVMGSMGVDFQFIIYHPVGAFWREPLYNAKVTLWCDEIGFREEKIATVPPNSDVAIAEWKDLQGNLMYYYTVEADGYQPIRSSIYAETGKVYRIQCEMRTIEEGQCPGWLRALSSALGLSCEQGKWLIIGLIVLAIILILGIVL